MEILIDTRDQKPWAFPQPGVSVCRTKLDAGDYSVRGLETSVCLERKTLTDAVSTLMSDWIRFVKQLKRMAGMDVAAIVIEATPDDVYAKKYMGDANPESVMGKCHALYLDYGVPVLWWGTREAAQREAFHFLKLAHSKLR